MLVFLIALALSVCHATRAISYRLVSKDSEKVDLTNHSEFLLDFFSGRILIAPNSFQFLKLSELPPSLGRVLFFSHYYRLDNRKFTVLSVSDYAGTEVDGTIANLASEDQLFNHFLAQPGRHFIFEISDLPVPQNARPYRMKLMIYSHIDVGPSWYTTW